MYHNTYKNKNVYDYKSYEPCITININYHINKCKQQNIFICLYCLQQEKNNKFQTAKIKFCAVCNKYTKTFYKCRQCNEFRCLSHKNKKNICDVSLLELCKITLGNIDIKKM